MDTQEGFLKALFDTRFGTLITPKIIRVLYVLIIIALGLVAIAFIIGAFSNSVGLGVVTLLIFAPIGFLIYLIVARIYLELVIVAVQDQRVRTADIHVHRHDGGLATSTAPGGSAGRDRAATHNPVATYNPGLVPRSRGTGDGAGPRGSVVVRT